jgi:hypothetical protein
LKKLCVAAFLSLALFSCKREPVVKLPVDNSFAITVNVDQTLPGYAIPSIFEGLSFETGVLCKNPEFLNENNTVLIQLLKNLGPGMLRIGGDTSDEIDWTGGSRSASTSTDSLTTTDIDRLSAFSKAIGWPVLFGLNLGSNHAEAAAEEALYTSNSLGSNLYAFQPGNEPDIYHMFGLRNPNYGAMDYLKDWDAYYSAIKALVPQASFSGPDVANNVNWVPIFAFAKSSNTKLLDAHFYIRGPATDPSISYHDLLETNFNLPGILNTLSSASSKYNLPFRVTECNSIWGGGKAGASDVFASALWSLDFMWQVAQNKGQGVNFHTGHGLIYSPVTMANGLLTPHPEYYAMLAFKYGSTDATIIPAEINTTQYNCTAYACKKTDNTCFITLINKEEKDEIVYTIQLKNPVSAIQVVRLTAPGMTSLDGITFAGSAVQADGTFKPGVPEQTTVNKNSFQVKVAAGSAVVITAK